MEKENDGKYLRVWRQILFHDQFIFEAKKGVISIYQIPCFCKQFRN